MDDLARDLAAFIDASPTPYHAVAESAKRLEAAGFRALAEGDTWQLAAGERCTVVRGQGSLIAFELGSQSPAEAGFRLVGAHTDSPNLRIKPNPDRTHCGTRQLAVEPYGGALLHTWLDRDLSLAGRVFCAGEGGEPICSLIDFRRALLRIPNLAIHLYRELREEGLKLNPQKHLVPVLGLESSVELAALLAEELGRTGRGAIPADTITGFDLMAYDLQPASRWGAEGEFIAAGRLDDLASCHAALCALTAAGQGTAVPWTRAVVLNDHEEVGSRSARGASGPFLADTLARLVESTGEVPAQATPRALAKSWLISADMAHAVHPNYADRSEPNHCPRMGGGPVIKVNANQAYATDGEGVAFFRGLCAQVGVTPQLFVTRSDLACGSTIGPLTAAQVGLRTIDVGSPLWAMHSCRETAAAADCEAMTAVFGAFFSGSGCGSARGIEV